MIHFYCLAVEAGFYSDVVECLPLDPAAQVRFPPRAVGIFLHPVTCICHDSIQLFSHKHIITVQRLYCCLFGCDLISNMAAVAIRYENVFLEIIPYPINKLRLKCLRM